MTEAPFRSKFHYVECKEEKDQNHFNFDNPFFPASYDGNHIACNHKYFAVPHKAANISVIPLLKKDRKIGEDEPRISAHLKPLVDLAFSPFSTDVLASSSIDCSVKIWKIPEGGLKKTMTEEYQVLQGHDRRVGNIWFHPTAQSVLVSTSNDKTIRLWDITKGECKIKHDGIESISLHVDFNESGNIMSVISKDKCLRLMDTRSPNTVIADTSGAHAMAQALRCVYCKDKDMIITTGMGKGGSREMKLWDTRNLSKFVERQNFLGQGSFMLFYDNDLGIVYLAGKGEGEIRYFDTVGGVLNKINSFRSTIGQKGICPLPKLSLNTLDHEIGRFLKMTDKKVIPIRVLFPRKSSYFQEDLFPETNTYEASNSVDDFFNTQEELTPLAKISLHPKKRPTGFAKQEVTIVKKKTVVDEEKEKKKEEENKYKKMTKEQLLEEIKMFKLEKEEYDETLYSLKQQREGDQVIKEFFQKKIKKIIEKEVKKEEIGKDGRRKKSSSQRNAELEALKQQLLENIDGQMLSVENEKLKKQVKEIEMHFQQKIRDLNVEIRKMKRERKREKEEFNELKMDLDDANDKLKESEEIEEELGKEKENSEEELDAEKLFKEKKQLEKEFNKMKSQNERTIMKMSNELEKLKTEQEQNEKEKGETKKTEEHKENRELLKNEISTLKTKLDDQERKMKDLQREVENTQNDLKKEQNKNVLSKKKVSIEEKEKKKALQRTKELEKELDELKKLREKEKKAEETTKNKKSSKRKSAMEDKKLKQAQEQLANEKKKNRELEKKNKDLEAKKKSLNDKMKAMKENNGKYEIKIEKYKESFEKMKETFKDKAQELQDKSKKFIVQLKEENGELKKKNESLEKKLKEANRKSSKKGSSNEKDEKKNEEEKLNYIKQIKKLKDDINELEEKNELLEIQVKEKVREVKKSEKKFNLLKEKVKIQLEKANRGNKQIVAECKKKIAVMKKKLKEQGSLILKNQELEVEVESLRKQKS